MMQGNLELGIDERAEDHIVALRDEIQQADLHPGNRITHVKNAELKAPDVFPEIDQPDLTQARRGNRSGVQDADLKSAQFTRTVEEPALKALHQARYVIDQPQIQTTQILVAPIEQIDTEPRDIVIFRKDL
jgi:rhodanese-related sulfurtransferase